MSYDDPANWTPAERELAGCYDYIDDDRPRCADCGRVVGEDEQPTTVDPAGPWSYYACCITAEEVAATEGTVA